MLVVADVAAMKKRASKKKALGRRRDNRWRTNILRVSECDAHGPGKPSQKRSCRCRCRLQLTGGSERCRLHANKKRMLQHSCHSLTSQALVGNHWCFPWNFEAWLTKTLELRPELLVLFLGLAPLPVAEYASTDTSVAGRSCVTRPSTWRLQGLCLRLWLEFD